VIYVIRSFQLRIRIANRYPDIRSLSTSNPFVVPGQAGASPASTISLIFEVYQLRIHINNQCLNLEIKLKQPVAALENHLINQEIFIEDISVSLPAPCSLHYDFDILTAGPSST
jgi:hypothetical protein